MRENCIEWLTGQDTVTLTLSQAKYISKIRKLKEKYPDKVEITAENADGSIVAHLPLKAVHLSIIEGHKGGSDALRAWRERQSGADSGEMA